MLLSLLKKSKSLLGVGVFSESNENDVVTAVEATSLDNAINLSEDELKETIYDYIRTIRDPEKPASLEDLHVVAEDSVMVKSISDDDLFIVRIEFNPTVPHCSLATLIGLCIRIKLERSLTEKYKLDIFIKKGTHSTEEEINRQINDKERIAAAMENPNLREIVENCIQENE